MLSEKNIPFETVEIDLKNKPDWFLKLSPYGKVPVLEHEGHALFESAIINEYLEEVFPQPAMLPPSAVDRALCRFMIDLCNSQIQPGVANILRAQPEQFAEKIAALESALERVESLLKERGAPAPYFMGEQFTLVDATYFPSLERMTVLPVLRGYVVPPRFERVHRWMTNMAARPSVKSQAIPMQGLIANYTSFVPEQVRRTA